MPKTKTSGQGRPKGALNKATKSVRELAATFTPDVISTLVEIAADANAPHAARVAACRELLDRAHGRPSATVEQPIKTADTLAGQGEQVLADMMTGKLPIEQAGQLMAALSAQAKLIEVSDITERLEALEKWLESNTEKS